MIQQILRNMASNYLRMFFGILSALFLMPLVLHKLGPEALGVWVLTNTVASYFSLTDLGITSAAIKYISHYRATQQWDELNKVISTSLACFSILAIVVLAGGFLVGAVAPMMFHISPSYIPTSRILMIIVGVVAAIGFASVIPVQCAIAAQRQDLLNAWMLAAQIVATGLSLTAVYFGGGIVLLGCIQIFSSICNGLIGFALTRKYLPQAKFRIHWYKEFGLQIASFAGFALVITVAFKVIYSMDALVIAHFLTMVAVAGYAIALKISDVIKAVVGCAAGVLGTFVCELSAREDVESLALIWMEGTKWALAMTMPICLLCVLSGSDLITSWVGRCDSANAIVLALLAIGNVFDTAQSAGFQIIVNGGKIKTYALFLAVEAVFNLGMSILLIKTLGVVGVAIGTVVPQIFRAGIFCPLFLSKITGVSLLQYVRKGVIPGLMAAALSLLIVTLYKVFGLHSGRLSLFILGLVLLPVEFAGMYMFCLTADQKVQVHQKLLQLSSRHLKAEA